MQGRKVAEQVVGGPKGPHRHLDYDKAASAIFTEPEIADVGLAEDKKIEIHYSIQVDQNPSGELYSVLIRLTPKQIPNFMGMTFKVFSDNHYDMSYGVGKTIAHEIRKQIS
jgi:pyruvate/2-oxoglutarate dehydrogenase complex dihydrolipoamide dehydrogenase (E3) component